MNLTYTAKAEPANETRGSTVRLTATQALSKFLAAQFVEAASGEQQYFAGVWTIFGHGNVAGMGEALYQTDRELPTFRAHNEQGMAHAAIAFAKQSRRERAMVCTTSIGPGATNMVTASALAHVNRLPVLFVTGDVFASRRPDPVLQQIEDFADGAVTANDCFRPVSAYFDRITRADQLLDALPRAMATMTDPLTCGPVTLAFCQDTQAEAYDYPVEFFKRRVWKLRRPGADASEVAALANALREAKSPLIVLGGGVRYSQAEDRLARFAAKAAIPFAETQAGKGAIPWDHPNNLGGIGVTGTGPANFAAANADLVIGIGTRLQDFTTASRTLFSRPGRRLVQINIHPYDAHKHGATTVVGDARSVIEALQAQLPAGWSCPADWLQSLAQPRADWLETWDRITRPVADGLPTDAQVLGAVWKQASDNAVVVCAAGGLPGELHKLWRPKQQSGYHVEYGYSCMGYELAAGLGVKMAAPEREVHVMVGDGSYLMLNSELATSVMLGMKIIVTLIDNGGFGCINRLQQGCGGAPFNNLLKSSRQVVAPKIDFAAHAAALGAGAEKVGSLAELEAAFGRAKASDRSYVIVIDADPEVATKEGGAWWDVAIPEVSPRPEVNAARARYLEKIVEQRLAD
jgi:3D-(3,5/4)-trihydroxycyclohexane-1,2-dione acylhydrolase (decyclizing)